MYILKQIRTIIRHNDGKEGLIKFKRMLPIKNWEKNLFSEISAMVTPIAIDYKEKINFQSKNITLFDYLELKLK